ncbi:MAG: hypothetical protein M5U07_10400 [Xanthobacteraceae bacterium]|nr:hypothetical protein [Xanthobacteraceae bacterium]
MTTIRPGRPDDKPASSAEFEGEIREFVRRDVAPVRKPGPEGDLAATNINSLIQRVSGASVQEIDKLIAELQGLRDYLQAEGERVQREIMNYAQLSQATTNSTKVIAESMAQWKSASGHART